MALFDALMFDVFLLNYLQASFKGMSEGYYHFFCFEKQVLPLKKMRQFTPSPSPLNVEIIN